MFFLVVIGRCDYSGYDFTIGDRKGFSCIGGAHLVVTYWKMIKKKRKKKLEKICYIKINLTKKL